MKRETIKLNLSAGEIENLKVLNGRVIAYLEEGQSLSLAMLSGLEAELSRIVKGTPELCDLLKKIENSGDYYLLRLEHEDTEILNLPWAMAEDPVSGRRLGDIGQLYLSRGVPGYFDTADREAAPPLNKSSDQTFSTPRRGEPMRGDQPLSPLNKSFDQTFSKVWPPAGSPKAGPPLKVLVMISSPEDSEWKSVLSYDKEEYSILEAFQPLLQAGLVEIDFTEDGSLEALTAKLKKNKYHVLHFSGHGVFLEGTGYLQMENPLTLKTEFVKAADFAEALNCNPDYRVPLVMLSSCQTAQGSTEEGLRGVTNQLLKKGIRAVVSMSMSVDDNYAALFSARFYRVLSEKENIFSAFKQAVRFIKDKEQEDQIEANITPAVPLQWLIPSLYLGGEIEHLVDWNLAEEKLQLSANRPVLAGERILLEHNKNYLFIGRRKDKAAILKPFFDKTPILLKGQGGVGKTALAEHLVMRLAAKNPGTVPFVFDEKVKALDEILDRLEKFLLVQGNMDGLKKAREFDKGIEKFAALIFSIAETHEPVFIFDNLETFQVRPGQDFAPQYGFLMEVIAFLISAARFHLILTCRYPLQGMGDLRTFDLNQVSLNDFWKKCNLLEMKQIGEYLRGEAKRKEDQGDLAAAAVEFIDVVKLLHRSFGGNYRALEFFNRLLVKNPEKIASSLASLEKFQENYAEETASVKVEMGRNLLFSELMALLEEEQQEVLAVLSTFRTSVLALALRLQWREREEVGRLVSLLDILHDLTLIEISYDPELENFYYYVTPIVKDLLQDYKKKAASFSYRQAGVYHYYMFFNMGRMSNELEEAFYFFYLCFAYEVLPLLREKESDEIRQALQEIPAGLLPDLSAPSAPQKPPGSGSQEDIDFAARIKKRIGEIGDLLSSAYHEYSMFHTSFYYAERTHHLLGNETPLAILNRLGLILQFYGKYDEALQFFEKILAGGRNTSNRNGEARALNNISQIYFDRGDYDNALKYLQNSLTISREIGDNEGEGSTLGNIANIYYSRSDYNSAIQYMRKSIKVFQDIGEKTKEAIMLSNISGIYRTRGDYDTALKYLQDSLNINREIDDKEGMTPTLHNMAHIALEKEDISKFLEYETEAYQIAIEIGNALGLYSVGKDFGYILCLRGNKEEGLMMLKKSYEIGSQAGFPGVDEIAALLKEFGE